MPANRNIKRIRSASGPEEVDQYLVSDLFKQEYVLLIGSEAIFNKNCKKTQDTGDSMFRLYNAYADVSGISETERPKTDHDWQILLSPYFKMENLRHVLDGLWGEIKENDKEAQENHFRKKCKDLIDENFGSEVEDSLYKLLDTKSFPVVFTTCIDDVLEMTLKDIWKSTNDEHGNKEEPFVVYNFQYDDDISKFNKMVSEQNKMNLMSPCLIYLFGKIGDERGSVFPYPVFSEDAALRAVARYIRQQDCLSQVYLNFLQYHPLMSIGCHFDDWRFRFFWYALRNNAFVNSSDNGEKSKDNNDKVISKGTVAYPVSDPDPLKQYLTNHNVAVEPDSRKFMERLAWILLNKDNIKTIIQEKRRKATRGIFISYASEEFSTAIDMFENLNKVGFNVWIDHKDLRAGEPYEERIKKAIRDCGIFMPILGHQAKQDLSSENLSRYYMDEWEYAYNCNKRFMPITFADYSSRDAYHEYFKKKSGLVGTNDIHIKTINELNSIIEELNRILTPQNQ